MPSLPMKALPLLTQTLSFALVLSTAFMLWKSLSILSDSHSPIVVVLSGSMEPAFQRGDLLFLWNRNTLIPPIGEVFGFYEDVKVGGPQRKDARVGEIVVYEVEGKDIPIVHRVVRRFGGGNKPLQLLTKGDNNAASDEELYARGQSLLDRDRDVVGSVVGFIPFVGYGTILLSEYPWLKTVMLGLMGLTVVLQREG